MIMPSGLQVAMAGLPILVILILMLGLRSSAAKAGSIGLVITIFVAVVFFDFGLRLFPELGVLGATAGGLAEAIFIALTILWIIFPALCIHELQQSSGAIASLRNAIGKLSADPRITALLIAWFFALFMEGAAGFGTAAALAAPFLVSMGFGKIEAVCIVLIGHSIGVSFGAVGTPILPQIAVTPYTGLELSAATAIYHSLLGWIMALAAMLFVSCALPRHSLTHSNLQHKQPQSDNGKYAIWGWTLAAAALFLLPFYLIATYVGPELPTLGGALLGAILFIGLILLSRRRDFPFANFMAVNADAITQQRRKIFEAKAAFNLETNTENTAENGNRLTDTNATSDSEVAQSSAALFIASAPYLILVLLILVTRLIEPLQNALQNFTMQWQFSVFQGSFAYLYHPGTMLFISFLLGAYVQRGLLGDNPISEIRNAMQNALRRILPVTVALIAMLGLSRIMVHAEMIDTLAIAAAASAGSLWPLFVPFVGVLGTFVTGSATASNILFTEFQQASAERLNFSTVNLLGAQGFGAAVGNSICPHNIIAASATVNLAGQEGEVLRRTIGVVFVYALSGGLLALFVLA